LHTHTHTHTHTLHTHTYTHTHIHTHAHTQVGVFRTSALPERGPEAPHPDYPSPANLDRYKGLREEDILELESFLKSFQQRRDQGAWLRPCLRLQGRGLF